MRHPHAYLKNGDSGLTSSGLMGYCPTGPEQDAATAEALRHRWRCTCGHVEIATDPLTLRLQARVHHFFAHGEAGR